MDTLLYQADGRFHSVLFTELTGLRNKHISGNQLFCCYAYPLIKLTTVKHS